MRLPRAGSREDLLNRDEVLRMAMAKIDAQKTEIESLRADKRRLDHLDAMNRALNERYGTRYGWALVVSHNVNRLMLADGGGYGYLSAVDLHDSQGGHAALPSCRDAIDKHLAEVEAARRARERKEKTDA